MKYKSLIYTSIKCRVKSWTEVLLLWCYLSLTKVFHPSILGWTQYALVNSKEERKNLYSILFGYVLHQINETCVATRVNEYGDDEIRPLATLLAQTNAADAFYISVKLGVEGIGGLLRRSIASPLSRYSNSERLNTVLLSFLLA